jgi:hypothetical protein
VEAGRFKHTPSDHLLKEQPLRAQISVDCFIYGLIPSAQGMHRGPHPEISQNIPTGI